MAEKSSKPQPLADRVIVEPLEQKDKTPSGLQLPEIAKEKPQEGIVVAIGPGRWDEGGKKRVEMEVLLGDRVIFVKYAGNEIKFNGKKYLIMNEKDILAVL